MESMPDVSCLPAGTARFTLHASPWAWRLAIFLLPWQIRWFSNGPIIGGYPWEQGRIAIYLSWLPMLVVIGMAIYDRVVGARSPRPSSGSALPGREALPLRMIGIGIVLMLIPSFFSLYPRATFQFWSEVIILGLFIWSLKAFRVPRSEIFTWFVISLIPHTLLALWQFHDQSVFGSKWLGVAAQNPLTQGVSVIEYAQERVLRAYGGFPHPNIFGGWLAMALPTILLLVREAKHQREKYFWMICGGLFSVILILTFSRGAWTAAVIGLIFLFLSFPRRRESKQPKIPAFARMTNTSSAFLIILLSVGLTIWYVRPLILHRFDAGARLEQRSLNERAIGWDHGWHIFQTHQLIGIGPGATGFALQSQLIPHHVPLLMLDEIGIVGMIGVLIIICSFRSNILIRIREIEWVMVVFLVLSLFDHYPWSLWSGRALVAFVIAYIILQD